MTYPSLIYIEKEPLPFRPQWFSHCSSPTTARILIRTRSTCPSRQASVLALHQPNLHAPCAWTLVSANSLDPIIFGAHTLEEWAVTHSLRDCCF